MKAILTTALIFSFLALPAVARAQSSEAESADGAAQDVAAQDVATGAPTENESSGVTMVEGAPLGNQNVHVHIIERKPQADQGRHELALYPATLQVNGKYTTHVGAAAMYSYHLFENLALTVTPLYNYINEGTEYSQELLDNGSQKAKPATAMLLDYGAVGGLEIAPIYGKFALYNSVLAQFQFVLSAGVGVGMTRVQLNPENDAWDAAFGSVGPKVMGSVGAGFRVLLGERVALRLELRDFVYTATIDEINGCNLDDLSRLDGNPSAAVASTCRASDFADRQRITLAKNIVRQATSDVINNLSFFGGIAILF